MNPFGREEVEHLADLSGLEVARDELESVTGEIAAIIEYISRISEVVDIQDAGGMDSAVPNGVVVPLRIDEVQSTSSKLDPRSFAPELHDGLFLVPRLESIGDE